MNRTPAAPPPSNPPNDWLDRLTRFNLHFGRFLRDSFGIILLAAAAISMLGMWGLSNGQLLIWWVATLSVWFGWGSYILFAEIAFVGIVLLRRGPTGFGLGRVLALELASLLTLSLLAAFGGLDLTRANEGMDGGRIGWGLAKVFFAAGSVWGTVIMFLLWLASTMGAFNVWAQIEKRLVQLADDAQVPQAQVQSRVVEEPAPKPAPPR